jgi:hypothetical protein
MIGRAHFSLDELTTALAEIEAVLNSHPLTYISSEDMDEPITLSCWSSNFEFAGQLGLHL